MSLRKLLALAVLAALAAVPAALAAEPVAGSWTGWITDTHCGKNGANRDHTADCVTKCMKGGSKPQLYSEADGKLFDLDSFDKVKALVGQKVTIKGSLDASKNLISVASADKAS
jgi:hypothetical protein